MNKLIALGICLLALTLVLFKAASKQEFAECQKWKQEAESKPDYYLTNWQYDQCLANNIHIDGVPVHD